jgi:hypothetical protein
MTNTLLTAKRSDSHNQYYMLVFIDREQDGWWRWHDENDVLP